MDTTTITYPYLPEGRSIFYVSDNDPFMARAKVVRDTMGTEKQHPTGAVVVKDGQILGEAANMAGYKHAFLNAWHKKWMCFRRWFKIPSGQKYWLCPGCATNTNHAETRATLDAIKKNGSERVKDADLYLYGHWWCCQPCWNAMIEGGIKNVYLPESAKTGFRR